MNECWSFFRYASENELERINRIIEKNGKWFSHVKKEHIYKKIKNKQCIFENGIILTFRITEFQEKLGNILVSKNSTILEQLVKENINVKNSYTEHVFTKFINCSVGNTYLSVNHTNTRAINFYYKMNMIKKSEFDLNNEKKIIIFEYKKSEKLH